MDCYDALPRQTTRLGSKQSRSLVSSSVVLPATSFEELLFIVPASNFVEIGDARTRFLVQGSCPRVLMQQELSVDFLHSSCGSWREWMLDLHHAWNDHSYSCRLRVTRSRLSAIAASKSWASRQKKVPASHVIVLGWNHDTRGRRCREVVFRIQIGSRLRV
jgi:hypothetical protein